MITREMFVEKLSDWLTADTIEKLAAGVEHGYVDLGDVTAYEQALLDMGDVTAYEQALLDMGEHTGDASGLYGYLEYMAGQLDNDDAVAVMAEDMIDEW